MGTFLKSAHALLLPLRSVTTRDLGASTLSSLGILRFLSGDARPPVDDSSKDTPPAGPSTQAGTSTSEATSSLGWLQGPEARSMQQHVNEEWVAHTDSKSDQVFWKSHITGEKTAVGVPKPETWTEVVDKSSGLLYYWNRRTGEVTRLGESKPGPYGRRASSPETMPRFNSRTGRLEETPKVDKDSEKHPPLTLLALYNNPLGWFLMGIALLGIVQQTFFKDSNW